jgi:AAA domain
MPGIDDPDFIKSMSAEDVEREEYLGRHPPGANGEAKNRRRFSPIRCKDIILSKARPYLVRRLLPRDGLIVIWGPPKCGKTFWTLDIAMHVARGLDYRGYRVHQGTVIYIASEGERGLSARIEVLRQSGLAGGDPAFYLLSSRLNLVKDVDTLIADIRTTLGEDQCVLIVIDTLNRTIAGSESKDEDMGAYIGAADRLREAFGAAIALIHHCGINGDRPRGHSSLGGALDAQIAVEKNGANHVIATVEWMKDGPEGEMVASQLVPVEIGFDEDGELITSLVVEPVAEDEAVSNKTASKAAKLSPANRRALDLLKDAIARGGEVPPADNHIPANTLCVTEGTWRDACYLGAVTDSEKPDAKKKAFQRAAAALVGSHVGKWGQWVWPV